MIHHEPAGGPAGIRHRRHQGRRGRPVGHLQPRAVAGRPDRRPDGDREGGHGLRRQGPVQPKPQPRPDAGGQLGGRAGRRDPPRHQHHDAVGQPFDIGQVVARQQDSHTGRPLLRDEGPHHGPGFGIHPGRRLVEDQDLGPPDEGQGEPESLPLPAGEPAERGGRHGPQAQQVNELVGVGWLRMEPGVLLDRLAWSRPQVDAAGLEHETHAGSQRPPAAHRVLPEDPHRAGVGASIALDDLDGRRLARPIRTSTATTSPGAPASETPSSDGSLGVPLAQVLDADGRGRHGAIRP